MTALSPVAKWRIFVLRAFSLAALSLLLAISTPATSSMAQTTGSNLRQQRDFAAAKAVALQNGLNPIDLFGDGRQGMVFVARQDFLTAHDFSSLAFYTKEENQWYLISFFGGPMSQGADGVDRRDMLGTSEGADCTLQDVRIIREKSGIPVTVIIAKREFGESYASAAPVRFDVYHLKIRTHDETGEPRYGFMWSHSIKAQRNYCNVNYAFDRELGLGNKGLGLGGADINLDLEVPEDHANPARKKNGGNKVKGHAQAE